MDINLDFEIPTLSGMVFNFILSYLISRISKGIQIAKTNKNRHIKCKYVLILRGILFSSNTSKSIVLIVQIKEMIKILVNGIFLNPKGYETDIIPEKIIESEPIHTLSSNFSGSSSYLS